MYFEYSLKIMMPRRLLEIFCNLGTFCRTSFSLHLLLTIIFPFVERMRECSTWFSCSVSSAKQIPKLIKNAKTSFDVYIKWINRVFGN